MNSKNQDIQRLLFIGLSGYSYPHTRVRCFHFADALNEYADVQAEVLSYRDHICPNRSEVDMFDNLRDVEKIQLVMKALWHLKKANRETLFYVQKAHYHSAAPYLMHRLLKRKFIFDYDDYDVELSVFFGRGTWNRLFFGTRDWKVITETMAARAVACVASSHLLYDFLRQYNPRTYLIPTGVDVQKFRPPSDGEARENREGITFLWTGLVWGEEILQSVCQVLKAFASVATVSPEARLQIVGGGQRMPELQDIVKREYQSLNIDFLGWKHPTEMPEILRHADVGLLPFANDSIWTRSKSPTKLFEYMASGLAVVANSIGEVKHVIDDRENGFLVADVDEFAERMIEVASDGGLRERLGKSARKKADAQFSLTCLGKKLYTMLKDLHSDNLL